jgi:flagellar FliL protein
VSAKTEAVEAAPAKSKKLLLIVGLLVVVLVLAAGGAWVYISKQRAAAEDGDEVASAPAASHEPPVYLPLDNQNQALVVNLADPGGEKVAQVGVVLEVADAHASDEVKKYLPTIRSATLLMISQRTAAELLSREGKDKLAADILHEAGRPFGAAEDSAGEDKAKKKKPAKKEADKAHSANPVRAVLFSSFIVQ